MNISWKITPKRLQSIANFTDSNSKPLKNQYVKLEPRSNEIFEISDRLLIDSTVQVIYIHSHD